MHPVLVDLSENIKIYSFGTFIVLAFLVASFYVRRRAAQTLDIDREQSFSVCFWLLFIALAGARLLYVLLKYDRFAEKPMSLFYVWQGGLVWYGGLLACCLWLWWYLSRRPELHGWKFVDILALGACLAIFVGRWASFLSGENYGERADGLPWAISFPSNDFSQVPPSERNIPLHPTQLYHSLHGLVLFVLLRWFASRKPDPGRVTGLFLMLYAVGRFLIEVWRGDDEARGMVIDNYISTSQMISVPVFVVGLLLFMLRKARDDTELVAA